MATEILAAVIGVVGIVIGFALSEFRARIEQRAQQTSMLIETLHNLSGSPSEIVTGASIALKYHKRNQAFHDILIPVLLASSLRLSEKERNDGSINREESHALYAIWCVIGSIWMTRFRKSIPEIEEHYEEFKHIEQLYLETVVGKECGRFAMEKNFVWLSGPEQQR